MGDRANVAPVVAAGLMALGLLVTGASASPAATPGVAGSIGSAGPAGPARSTGSSVRGLIVFSTGFILNDPDVEDPAQVVSVRPDGSGEHQLTHVPKGKQAGAPDLSEDGRRIVYVSNVDGNFAVWVMRADGTHQHRLFGRAGVDFLQPRWSPDGRRLVVTRCDARFGTLGRCDLRLVRSDGLHGHTLVGGVWRNGDATFSPNGRWVAFDGDRRGFVSTVWKVPVAGGRPVRLTKPNLEAFWPAWSPDGRHLLVSSNCCRPQSDVFRIRADGSRLRQLTHVGGGGGAAFASYSPDGRRIVFSSDQLRGPDFATTDLFVMRANGTHQHRIVHDRAIAVGGDWERR